MSTATEVPRGAVPHPDITHLDEVNQDVLKALERPGLGWWMMLGLAITGIGILAVSWGFQMWKGIGVTGLGSPVGWGVYITTFVFWVGIAHSGTLISAILFLFRAPWRQSIYRAAEAMTVFAVMTAGLFPLIHVGRVWHAYWLIPYPNSRFLWPNFRSPLVWDVFAVTTYFTVSAVFFYLGTIPDLAAARDAATGMRKKLYKVISLGWRGTDREWHHFGKAYIFLAALATPLVLSVHSVVSWDFAVAIVPGWHATIFAPYFVAGAIFSGVAMVITLTVPLRKAFGLDAYLTTKHYDAMAKLCLLTSMIVLYAYLSEFFMAWYSGEEVERAAFWERLFGPYWWAGWTMLVCNGMVPVMLWFKRVRYSIPALFVISIFVNIGMWFERFVIIATSLHHEYEPFAWGLYRPSLPEMGIMVGSFAWFGFWFLLFTRVLPPVAIAELKEVLPTPMRRAAPAYGGTKGGRVMSDKVGLLASFEYVDSAVNAIEGLRGEGLKEITAYMPYPEHHIEEALGYDQSPVRVWALAGGLCGAAGGFAFTSFTSMDWPLVTGGKPILSIPAYVIISFEMAVLFGVLSTVIGLFINSRLPYIKPMVVYDPEFSAGKFGVYVTVPRDRLGRARDILQGQEPSSLREDPEGVGHAS